MFSDHREAVHHIFRVDFISYSLIGLLSVVASIASLAMTRKS